MQSATERRQEILYFISDRRRVKYRESPAGRTKIRSNTVRRGQSMAGRLRKAYQRRQHHGRR